MLAVVLESASQPFLEEDGEKLRSFWHLLGYIKILFLTEPRSPSVAKGEDEDGFELDDGKK